ncbi:MAG: hypothetical protein WCX32_02120 [Clostridia bacterium]|jgi:hypothetical protein|nr:hypothetical protein [Clostridia bacterium]
MTTNNIIELAASYLELEDINEYLLNPEGEHTTNTLKIYSALVKCVSYVYSQIATDLLPLVYSEQIVCTDKQFNISNLTKRVIDIISITNENAKINFKVYPTYVECMLNDLSTTNITVKYCYLPDFPTNATDDLLDFCGKMTPRTFAYGVATEYCMITGAYDEANIWDKRFKDCVLAIYHKKREVKIPPRRWL